ncbi:Coenzyme F420 hydrogenase/dehydrogenase, beta subunit C-terminal domain [Mesorhizobium sp. SP-1A]|uniref:Coenzyme F420 hydrogenase/dehydrogenase, beta subunit C-terminal domain n=1 Tax=Mesorhizobium sp. SP-1A TaxID=3077840 RepID=UPI0028F73B65|nr:Coenzyme F420 hydrogenase/dehydrogenase, beta subunit C-terminal domain [Mesorhizobium sp. SP-1A]
MGDTPHPDQATSPRGIMRGGLCIGCGCCVAQSSAPDARMIWDKRGQLKPAGGDWLDDSSPRFNRTCPFAPGARDEDALASALFPAAAYVDPDIGRFSRAYIGHVCEDGFRALGSSGGMVSWTASELLRRGLVDGVAHVIASPDPRREGLFFRYTISRTIEEVRAGACSRYYPTELSSVLRTIRARPGRYAVVGVPCFVKAINLQRAEDEMMRERIAYTLGLFCGHMKSARFADSLALQMGVDPDDVVRVDYRIKAPGRPASWYRARLTLGDGSTREKDWWHLADGDWGAGFFQNSACNFCDDVVAETADISFGDAWVEPYSSDPQGTNVVVVRNPELEGIVRDAIGSHRLALHETDAHFVRETQAAGLRQRREGLAYRLEWRSPALALRKRVSDRPIALGRRRALIYRTRYRISMWSHRIFAFARRARLPAVYVWWAGTALSLYQGLAYSRGAIGRICDTLLKGGSRR